MSARSSRLKRSPSVVAFETSADSEDSMAKVAGVKSKVSRTSGSRLAASSVSSTRQRESIATALVVCIDTCGHDDLQARRIYQALPDASAAKSHFLRVIDDSGEDYLYPESCFLQVDLPQFVQAAIAKSSYKPHA